MDEHVGFGLAVYFIPLFTGIFLNIASGYVGNDFVSLSLAHFSLLLLAILRFFFGNRKIVLKSRTSFLQSCWQYGWRSYFLGLALWFGLGMTVMGSFWRPFGWYVCTMSVFHYTEFATTAIIKPSSVNLDSFLLNHSWAYGIAAASSWIEFFLESFFFPGVKEFQYISLIGLIICFGGELLRKGAMFTAGKNFDHLIRYRKERGHTLVTSGVYRWSRHPSYVGWFWWSVGTQIILCNPVCLLLYIWASWTFFNHRIYDEEMTLLAFFGDEYTDYQKRVGTGLPFIKGYTEEVEFGGR